MSSSTIDKNIATWLRDVDLERGTERQDAIVAAARSLASKIDGTEILDIVSLAHGMDRGSAFSNLSEAIREYDASFGLRADDLESRLAAAVTVAATLEVNSKSASTAALAVESAAWLGLNCPIPDLINLARAAGLQRSELLRDRRPALSAATTDKFFAEVDDFTTEGHEAQPVQQQNIAPFRAGTEKAIKAVNRATANAIAVLQSRLDAADEELDILWWAFGERSEHADAAWQDIPTAAASVVAGIELAQHVRFDVLLPSTRSMLSRVLAKRADSKLTIGEAVESSAEYLSAAGINNVHPLLPVVSAASEYTTLNGDDAWRKGAEARHNVSSSHIASALDFACQSAREFTISRNL